MQKFIKLTAVVASVGLLAACDNDLERGVAGAVAGGVVAEATGNDVGTGALIGAGAGVFCDDVGVCN